MRLHRPLSLRCGPHPHNFLRCRLVHHRIAAFQERVAVLAKPSAWTPCLRVDACRHGRRPNQPSKKPCWIAVLRWTGISENFAQRPVRIPAPTQAVLAGRCMSVFWQLAREKSLVPKCSGTRGNSSENSKAIFQNDIRKFESSRPSQRLTP